MGECAAISFSLACPSGCRTSFVRRGFFSRSSDGQQRQRYQCSSCRRTFSEASFEPCFGQRKRQINPIIFRLLTGGYSQRRAAMDLKVNRKTIVRKLIFLGLLARHLNSEYNSQKPLVTEMEFDDLETFEHTKCKPLSVTLAVETGSRRVLGFRVKPMPANGKLATLARRKYGPRKDERPQGRDELFTAIKADLAPDVVIKSDQNPHYVACVRRHFPGCEHRRYKGRKPRSQGLGELKKGRRDPLASLNHTCAMLRANINRLFRKTWCTTKKMDRFSLHIELYLLRHNLDLIHHPAK